ncbi:hypothetical protein G6011_10292 [Alternaria panax]|uniref:Uncharacterized protein n=1 Tax=Alternaria panax TaxID=48097 RepID=A0AAD4NPG2_9PLEO|nr:hypothetical protein G6011_10292 [Alternaria panax]
MIKLERSATCEPTTFDPNSLNRTDIQTTANSIPATLSEGKKVKPLGSCLDVTGVDLLSTTHTDANGSWTTHDSPMPPALNYTQFQRPLPEQVSSIFPSDLPPRPSPKRSFPQRLVDLSTHPAHSAQPDESISTTYTAHTPDIELGVLGEDDDPHDIDRLR